LSIVGNSSGRSSNVSPGETIRIVQEAFAWDLDTEKTNMGFGRYQAAPTSDFGKGSSRVNRVILLLVHITNMMHAFSGDGHSAFRQIFDVRNVASCNRSIQMHCES